VPPSPDGMVASALEDIAPTYPYKDPILGTGATGEVAYTTLVDQHMVSLEGMEDRKTDLLLRDGLLLVRHLERPKDACVALFLSFECPPSAASYLSPALEGT
jgi:hypothetical protein